MIVETELAPDPAEVPWINPDLRAGERRKVITGIPGKTGLIWTLDAETGEFLWARPTVYQNIMTGLDLRTGRPSFDESTAPTSVQTPSFACPHLLGGKNQPSGAYSPDTDALYMPLNNACMDIAMSVEEAGPSDGYDIRVQVRHLPDVEPETARSVGWRRCRRQPDGRSGVTNSARRSTVRCSRRAAISSSRATSCAASVPITPRPARSSGRRSSTDR